MAKPHGTKNVTADELRAIRRLYLDGVRIADIVEETGRAESVVYRATRDLERKKPPPPSGKHAKRNDRILRLVEQGLSRKRVGEIVGIAASQVGKVVMTHPHVIWLLRVRKMRPSTVAKRYRMELATAKRIAMGASHAEVPRSRQRPW